MALQEYGKVKDGEGGLSFGSSPLTTPPNTNEMMGKKQIETPNTSAEVDEDDLRIQEIKEEAKRRALIEIEGLGDILANSRPTGFLSTAMSSRSGSGAGAQNAIIGSSSDDEDDLMDLDLGKLLDNAKKAPSHNTSKRNSPASSRPKKTADEYLALYGVPPQDDDDDNYKAPSYATQSIITPSQRPKREAARKIPYSYKLALERPSESRQLLSDARHSAAVKMGILRPESWKQSVRSGGSNEVVKRLIRERNKEIREGTGSEGVKLAIAYIEKSRQYMEDEDDLIDSLSERDASDMEDESDDLSDDDIRASVKLSKNKRIKTERHEETLARFENAKADILKQLENGEEEEEGQRGKKALEIIEKDCANGIAANSTEKDFGVTERNFWDDVEQRLPTDMEKLCVKKPSGLLATLVESQSSSNHMLIAQILRTTDLLENLTDTSFHPFTVWLVEQAMLNNSEDVSLGAVVALEKLLDSASNGILHICIDSLISALRSLGMRDDTLPRKEGEKRMDVEWQSEQSRKVAQKFRLEKLSKFIALSQKIGKSLSSSSIDCKPLLLCLFRIMVDPAYDFLRGDAKNAVSTLMEASFTHCQGFTWDIEFQDNLCSFLRSKYFSTKLAYLQCLPCDSLRSRILMRNIAVRLITQKDNDSNTHSKPQTYAIPDNFDLLLSTLQRQDDSFNSLWVAKGEGKANFAQLEASITVLQYCFIDLLLQLCFLNKGQETAKESKKRAFDRLIAADLENLITKDPILSQRLDRIKAKTEQKGSDANKVMYNLRLSTSKRKVVQVEEIIRLLYIFNDRILESTTNGSRKASSGLAAQMLASESQIRAKDALQRNALLLTYTLDQYNLRVTEENESGKKEQGTLDNYFNFTT